MNENVVQTYNFSGKMMYEKNFVSGDKGANEAYKEYCNIIDNCKRTLPKGYGVTVIRLRWGKVMTEETVIGTH